ncbi:NADP-dependent glyceraldehyde-3-phosphate dehydrogenase-like [Zingiber officinale]|uniref:NADP-dependent glyceraldehyde-3-phosphate dehydrogenase-like n=1 Tax=Zingiber officinale TaxID=94328 RepID=UPI001C4C9497|nr:NADP-dependent glyceraldehyde-3-phosphate dehydrogenase-like [Zingiber officinale]
MAQLSLRVVWPSSPLHNPARRHHLSSPAPPFLSLMPRLLVARSELLRTSPVSVEEEKRALEAVVVKESAMAGSGVFTHIVDENQVFKYYAEGEWKKSASGKTVSIVNPTTRKTQYNVQACTQEEVNKVMEAAKAAQRQWARTPLWKRAELLHKAAEILKENKDPIAECLVKEIAKPAKDAVTEVVRSGDLLSYTAEEGVRILGEGKLLLSDSFPGNERNKYCLSSKIPLGIVLAIPPFNYPVNLAVSKIGPALIAGNSLVLKPPTQGSVAALHMVHCFHLAGFPKGLISCITGKGSEIGDFMTMHPGVNCISFTGGDTGIAISKKAGMIPLQMELGGKDACIVLEDADLDLVATNIVQGGYSYSGQRCTAVKVVLIMESVADEFVEKVNAKMAKLSVGTPEENCDITPVISESSANFIEGLVMDAKEKGATFCQEYKREGNLIWPLLLDHVRANMRIAWEEPFGPVLPVIRIRSVKEAIHHCNASNFGLQGSVFTKDINKAITIGDAIESGTIQINSAPARGPDHFPFQGLKDSGIGSQGIVNSINMMTKIKSLVINLPSPSYTMG